GPISRQTSGTPHDTLQRRAARVRPFTESLPRPGRGHRIPEADGHQDERGALVGGRLLRPLCAARLPLRRYELQGRLRVAVPAHARRRHRRDRDPPERVREDLERRHRLARARARARRLPGRSGHAGHGVQRQHLDQSAVSAGRTVQPEPCAAPRRHRRDPEGGRDRAGPEASHRPRVAGLRRRRLPLPDRLPAGARVVHGGARHGQPGVPQGGDQARHRAQAIRAAGAVHDHSHGRVGDPRGPAGESAVRRHELRPHDRLRPPKDGGDDGLHRLRRVGPRESDSGWLTVAGQGAAFTIGVDYGTNSVRAVVVDCADGRALGTAVCDYPSGTEGVLLDPRDPHLARQNPADYLVGLTASVRGALAQADTQAGFARHRVIGIGVDTTGSTPLPVDAGNRPLALDPRWRDSLAAQAWLWKDHTAAEEAAAITETARRCAPEYLSPIGGTYSSEWFWSKIWHCRKVAPDVFDAAASWVELADFVPAVLAGVTHPGDIVRGVCAAGHKALYSEAWGGLPSREFL